MIDWYCWLVNLDLGAVMFKVTRIVYRKYMYYMGIKLLVPVWAKWGCVNENGELWVFSNKPNTEQFISSFSHTHARHEHICNFIYKGDWRESCVKLLTPIKLWLIYTQGRHDEERTL